MRSAVGLFGILCGAVVIWTVANYGYASADDPSARWNIAFLFAVMMRRSARPMPQRLRRNASAATATHSSADDSAETRRTKSDRPPRL